MSRLPICIDPAESVFLFQSSTPGLREKTMPAGSRVPTSTFPLSAYSFERATPVSTRPRPKPPSSSDPRLNGRPQGRSTSSITCRPIRKCRQRHLHQRARTLLFKRLARERLPTSRSPLTRRRRLLDILQPTSSTRFLRGLTVPPQKTSTSF